MKNEILREKLKNLSSQQLKLINDYCDNNMSKLKKISCDAFFRYGIPQYEHDELYDDAMDVLMESVITFDLSKGANFNVEAQIAYAMNCCLPSIKPASKSCSLMPVRSLSTA